MNYFKGSGSCGLSASPNYKKIKEGQEKLVINQNILINNNNSHPEIQLAAKA